MSFGTVDKALIGIIMCSNGEPSSISKWYFEIIDGHPFSEESVEVLMLSLHHSKPWSGP
jgi:hypothetical protein